MRDWPQRESANLVVECGSDWSEHGKSGCELNPQETAMDQQSLKHVQLSQLCTLGVGYPNSEGPDMTRSDTWCFNHSGAHDHKNMVVWGHAFLVVQSSWLTLNHCASPSLSGWYSQSKPHSQGWNPNFRPVENPQVPWVPNSTQH